MRDYFAGEGIEDKFRLTIQVDMDGAKACKMTFAGAAANRLHTFGVGYFTEDVEFRSEIRL